jgi:hypothetical protein
MSSCKGLIEHDSIKELDIIHELVDWQAIEQILKTFIATKQVKSLSSCDDT